MKNNNTIVLNNDNLSTLNHISVANNSDIIFHNISKSEEIIIDVINDINVFIKGIILGDDINLKIMINCKNKSQITGNLIDFSKSNSKIYIDVNLNDSYSNATFNSAILSSLNDKKTFTINVNHNAISTDAKVSTYGVCKDNGNLLILGTSDIKENIIKCNTSQNVKIMLIDKNSVGIAKPILKIANDDVKASHGASIGQLNEDHLFYLLSRGLSVLEAKKLIVLGYFNNVIKNFKDDELLNDVSNLLDSRL